MTLSLLNSIKVSLMGRYVFVHNSHGIIYQIVYGYIDLKPLEVTWKLPRK